MQVYIGLGSNLESPEAQIKTAIEDLKNIPQTQVVNSSSLYKSPPMGPQDQPDYINAVVAVETQLMPHALLDALQSIEQLHGRVRKRHWGERTLDLDILLFGDLTLADERLIVPHPGLAKRAFVVYPLAEIAENLLIPNLGSLEQIKEKCPLDGLQKVEAVNL